MKAAEAALIFKQLGKIVLDLAAMHLKHASGAAATSLSQQAL